MRKTLVIFFALISFSLPFVAGCTDSGDSQSSLTSADGEYKNAIDFNLTDMGGNPVGLSDYKGKVVLLDFWATWCPPCRDAVPHLIDLQERFGKMGLVVLGMTVDSDPEALAKFLKKFKINYKLVECDFETKVAYGVSKIPQMYLIDREGKLRAIYMGFTRELGREMEVKIVELI